MKIFYVNRLWLKFPQGLCPYKLYYKDFHVWNFLLILPEFSHLTHDKNNDSSYNKLYFVESQKGHLELSVKIFIILKWTLFIS